MTGVDSQSLDVIEMFEVSGYEFRWHPFGLISSLDVLPLLFGSSHKSIVGCVVVDGAWHVQSN